MMRSTFALPSLIILTAVLAACGTTPTTRSDEVVNSPNASTANVDDYIDIQIQGEERTGIRAHMLTLPLEDWTAITYIDFEKHKIYTNRVALQGLLSFAEKVPGSANLYKTSAGRLFSAPSDSPQTDDLRPLAQGTCAAGNTRPPAKVMPRRQWSGCTLPQ